MKTPCNEYTSEDISRFFDNELSSDQYHKLKQHLELCPECNLLIERYKSISTAFNDHADQHRLKIDPARLQPHHTFKNSQKKHSLENTFGFFGKNIYLKLASITAIVVISWFTFHDSLFGPAGPSAIVKSVDTEFASVMIIETQKDKHTIIWFSET